MRPRWRNGDQSIAAYREQIPTGGHIVAYSRLKLPFRDRQPSYSAFYYRGLAIVSVFSLTTAALLSWLAVILLSKYQGFTLSLADIGGLIVERLRDEVREGRSLRAALERGWQRARLTILVWDTVSFLAEG